MKFTLSWLRDHLETTASATAITDRLTMIGLELESLRDRSAGLADFVVGQVVDARRHPDAEKLRVCTVETGRGTVEVVCGAPNARAGMKGVFAAAGSAVPGTGITLRKARIRGVESNGMLLSEREMGLSDDHEGIVELPADASVGARAVDVMGLADPLVDVAITPDRGDCLGVRGIARDAAAAGLGTLKPLRVDPVPGTFASPIHVSLESDVATPDAAHQDACPYFVGRTIRGVRNAESPGWLKQRLLSVGLRPISALVDITNYMTLDLARPLHAFDADKVRGDLHVRLARPGERLLALNGREYALDPEMTVIADDVEAEALGGVIGGERSACTGATTSVFLESALFDPIRTASTGRKLGLLSDARYRFERGIDPTFLEPGMQIATRLVLEICGGEASELVVVGAAPAWRRVIDLRPERIRDLAGVEVSSDEAIRILQALGFEVERRRDRPEGILAVVPPPWRNDVVGEADLVEEVVRIYGYDRIPVMPMQRGTTLPGPALSTVQRRRSLARRVLAGRGLVEAVTFSFMSAERAALFGGVADALRLVNPISAELDVMRPSILPNLIAACGRNAARGFPDGALFEIGPQYRGAEPDDQLTVAAGVRSGRTGPRHWAQPPRPVDVFDAKADVLALLEALEAPVAALAVVPDGLPWYHPGRSGVLRLGPHKMVAAFGEIHPRHLREMGVSGPVAAFEVFLDDLPPAKARRGGVRAPLTLSALQPLERDFAFLVDADVPAARIIEAARGAEPSLIRDVRVFDVFSGESLGPGKKSVAITVVVQPVERTLTDADLDVLSSRLAERVERATGGMLRG